MSFELLSPLVHTVGVKCRGLSKPGGGGYAPEHVFSLSEKTANKLLKDDVINLIKHTQGHLIKYTPRAPGLIPPTTTPIGTGLLVSNHFRSTGKPVVSVFPYRGILVRSLTIPHDADQGFMINDAMFRRNGKAGYVLKPQALRGVHKNLLVHQTKHSLKVRGHLRPATSPPSRLARSRSP